MNVTLAIASTICGFWKVGSRNLSHWVNVVSEWIQGEDGPDIIHVGYETAILAVKVAAGVVDVMEPLSDWSISRVSKAFTNGLLDMRDGLHSDVVGKSSDWRHLHDLPWEFIRIIISQVQ